MTIDHEPVALLHKPCLSKLILSAAEIQPILRLYHIIKKRIRGITQCPCDSTAFMFYLLPRPNRYLVFCCFVQII